MCPLRGASEQQKTDKRYFVLKEHKETGLTARLREQSHCWKPKDVTRNRQAIKTTVTLHVLLLKQTWFPLTPGLRFNEFELYASSSLVILPDLPTHAEAQSYHVVLLTVPRAAALDVIQQSCLQRPTLVR